MSKSGELRILRYGRSIDAPINYRHRTGDVDGSGGNILDLYAQEESAEDVYFGNADEHAREMFVKGFKAYLKKVFTEQERQFLQGLLAGKESPYKIGRGLGVEHFSFLQSIQRKAYKNAKPLFKLARLTGWSGAEAFTGTIYERLEQLNAGFALNDIIPQNRRAKKQREKQREYMRFWRNNIDEQHREKIKKQRAEYRATHREEIRVKTLQYREENREKIRKREAEYYAQNREKILQYQVEYRSRNVEHIRLLEKQYRARNREKIKERKARYYIRKKAGYSESDRERIRQQQAEWREQNREEKNRKAREKYRANREEINKKRREQYSKNPRKITNKIKEYQAEYRAKKKAERDAERDFKLAMIEREVTQEVVNDYNAYKQKLAELATVAECVELVAVEGVSV